MFRYIKLFIRQPFTETSSKNDLDKIMSFINTYKRHKLDVLPYKSVGESTDFKNIFENKTGIKFNPENFRNYRLDNIRKCNAMFIMRNNLSESTAFELGHIYTKYPDLPIFFAIDNNCPIKTTLLQDLHPNVLYRHYNKPNDIKDDLYHWLDLIGETNFVLRDNR